MTLQYACPRCGSDDLTVQGTAWAERIRIGGVERLRVDTATFEVPANGLMHCMDCEHEAPLSEFAFDPDDAMYPLEVA